jgi:hypothetical protein
MLNSSRSREPAASCQSFFCLFWGISRALALTTSAHSANAPAQATIAAAQATIAPAMATIALAMATIAGATRRFAPAPAWIAAADVQSAEL